MEGFSLVNETHPNVASDHQFCEPKCPCVCEISSEEEFVKLKSACVHRQSLRLLQQLTTTNWDNTNNKELLTKIQTLLSSLSSSSSSSILPDFPSSKLISSTCVLFSALCFDEDGISECGMGKQLQESQM